MDASEPRSSADVPPSPVVATNMQIWERDSFQLHAVGEAADGLLPVLTWQPNGRHLYAAQQGSDAARVALFERNGLLHGGFDIPVDGKARRCLGPNWQCKAWQLTETVGAQWQWPAVLLWMWRSGRNRCRARGCSAVYR